MSECGNRPLILGLAREGASLARFLADRGASVTVTDAASREKLQPRIASLGDRDVRLVLGGDHPEVVDGADIIYVSPGVPESNAVYEAARDAGLPIRSATTLFFDLCPGTILGITGSSGKTTTTGLIGHILKIAGRNVVVGGNIGDPMIDLLPSITDETIVVLELSSFQLDLLRRSPHIAVVTNISPNHLDRHKTMDAYIAAKRHILQHQGPDDWAVLNAMDGEVKRMALSSAARQRWFNGRDARQVGPALGFLRPGHVRETNPEFQRVIYLNEIPLIGGHNISNILAAMAATDILGVSPEDMAEGTRTFRPAPHRLQTVGDVDGVRYVDDSIATSPARAIVGMQAIVTPLILIAGGRDKHLPWDDFAYWATAQCRHLVLIGEAAGLIEGAVRDALSPSRQLRAEAIRRCPTLEDAVALAARLAEPGDTVLLSPGCTSYDMFSDFEERGAAFARAVEALHCSVA